MSKVKVIRLPYLAFIVADTRDISYLINDINDVCRKVIKFITSTSHLMESKRAND